MKTIAGVEIHEEGQGHEVIVMIHGWPDTYRLWDKQIDALKSQYRCIRFTLPGFEQGGPRRACGLAEMIDIIRQIVETSCAGRPVILIAHDWGCFFAYQFVISHPTMVSKVIGLDIGDAGSRSHINSLSVGAKLMSFGYQSWLAAAWRIGGSVGDRIGLASSANEDAVTERESVTCIGSDAGNMAFQFFDRRIYTQVVRAISNQYRLFPARFKA